MPSFRQLRLERRSRVARLYRRLERSRRPAARREPTTHDYAGATERVRVRHRRCDQGRATWRWRHVPSFQPIVAEPGSASARRMTTAQRRPVAHPIERTADGYDYQLLVKHLLYSAPADAADQKIVY